MKYDTKKTKSKAAKRADRGVPFDEMRRLMTIYGSIKCLRKRQKPCGEDTKIDSVKRKFYRWFPDLEERFVKDEYGLYRPKAGHEFELRYREEMRARDGEILAKKRTRCRKERNGVAEGKTKRMKAMATSPVSPSSHGLTADVAFPSRVVKDIAVIFEHDPISSASIGSDTDPVDLSFNAKKGIFDDVEKSFYGQSEPVPERHISQWISCSSSSEEQPSMESHASWSSPNPSLEEQSPIGFDTTFDRPSHIKEMLEKSMEEYCEEILVSSDDNESVTESLFEMIIT